MICAKHFFSPIELQFCERDESSRTQPEMKCDARPVPNMFAGCSSMRRCSHEEPCITRGWGGNDHDVFALRAEFAQRPAGCHRLKTIWRIVHSRGAVRAGVRKSRVQGGPASRTWCD